MLVTDQSCDMVNNLTCSSRFGQDRGGLAGDLRGIRTCQKLAGRTIDPAVWVPSAAGTMPVATATADPLDDVPGVLVASWGLMVLSRVWTANSAVTVFPGIKAPASLH